VYDAVERVREELWHDSKLPTDQLLLTSSLTEEELNDKIMVQVHQKEHSKLSEVFPGVNCAVGKSSCLFKNRKAMVDGEVT